MGAQNHGWCRVAYHLSADIFSPLSPSYGDILPPKKILDPKNFEQQFAFDFFLYSELGVLIGGKKILCDKIYLNI